jgi:serine protease AprX
LLTRRDMERWLYGGGTDRRRLQDSPILPDVWYAYALPPEEIGFATRPEPPLVSDPLPAEEEEEEEPPREEGRVDLLLRPTASSSSSELARVLHAGLGGDEQARRDAKLVYNESYVACELTFVELIRVVLPLSEFWQRCIWPGERGTVDLAHQRDKLASWLLPDRPRMQGRRSVDSSDPSGNLGWLVGLVGRIALKDSAETPTSTEIVDRAIEILDGLPIGPRPEGPHVFTVSRNRPVQTSVWRSRIACKADAATTLFGLSCRDIRWAVIDSGIDARHPAFYKRTDEQPCAAAGSAAELAALSARSRIIGTWDFSRLRATLLEKPLPKAPEAAAAAARPARRGEDDPAKRADRMAAQVARGRSMDWDRIAPALQIAHDADYDKPVDDHGTHVAGILIGDWRTDDDPSAGEGFDIKGMCPDMEVYDLRAFDKDGKSDEFQILSAMQFVRHLNAHADVPLVHGVNLSFSVQHDVDKYAAGGTPVCEEATRLIGSGVVVVAAAGNEGRGSYLVRNQVVEGYRTVSITDPGNAEKVITVGATHREQPHTYGVSYFSSRGPTGDGRAKPDLVAPGEKITSMIPDNGIGSKDGTSQATPHVSGACAMLLARHPELVGHPEDVKQILVDSCTDLGRERYFQGAGMVDVLRAIQAV